MSQQDVAEVKSWIRRESLVASIIKLPGDASTRMYFRVITKDGQSYIVMKMEPFKETAKELPFIIVQKHLYQVGVQVPEILDIDSANGFLLLEDLGDITLLRKLQEVDDVSIETMLFKKVIDELIKMQVFASPDRARTKIDAFKLKFDFEKLFWEVNFTIEQFYELHLKREIKEAEKKLMHTQLGQICQVLADEPVVFTHRDFHSRNLMVAADSGLFERLVMIDFQDARMGPPQYDLASLLRDSYYQLSEKQIQNLLGYYMDQYEKVSGTKLDREHFIKIFDFMSIQRNFKAIGSFASFENKRGNSTYLKYIGNTFENIRRNLLKYPEYSKLREVLFHYYYF
ncbi:MAG: phosphotransferase [Xanthomonadaceae bacterium]|nr:phosphotransferase [Xanthomonadaceae bacterium]